MGTFVKIAETSGIPENTIRLFKVKSYEILVANIDGKFYAFENQCPHMGYPLYLGSLDGKVLTCGFHYARFDVTTGKSSGRVTDKCLKTYRVKIRDSSVLIELPKYSKHS
jgi:nitrite reductase/ring-hydroxylating ferredoxin subunit